MGRLIYRFLKYFSATSPDAKKLSDIIYTITRLHPTNLLLYKLALQHKTSKTVTMSNERLEFLGDSVLSLIVASYLYQKYPLQEEGFLTEIRARVVNRTLLNTLAKKIGMEDLLDKFSSIPKGSSKAVYGNALEALIGAVYLDQGYKRCYNFVINRLLLVHIDLEALVQTDSNYKSQIIAWAQKNRQSIQFELVGEEGRDKHRIFVIHLLIEGVVSGKGHGRNKKEAEQMAACDALKRLHE